MGCSPPARTAIASPTRRRRSRRPDTGEVLLSLSLPVREEPFSAAASRAYVEGLLPQGRRRDAIAAELGLDPGDGYGLIAELGGDCLGAVTFQEAGAPAPEPPASDSPAWLARRRAAPGPAPAPPAQLFDPADDAADALRPARRAAQAGPRPRRGERPLGLAGARHPQHPHRQARAARAPRLRRQRARLHARLPRTRPAGRPHLGGDDRRPGLPRLQALRPLGRRAPGSSACTRRASPRRSASPRTRRRGGSPPASPACARWAACCARSAKSRPSRR